MARAQKHARSPAAPSRFSGIFASTKTSSRKNKGVLLAEVFGWYGISAILGAYALASFEVLQLNGYTYQLLNLTGALGVLIIAYAKRVMQSVILNLFWALIALAAILSQILR